MAKPLFIKPLFERLQLLNRPIVWVPSGVFILLCLAVWQYYAQSNQTELAQPELSAIDNPSATDLSTLSKTDRLELLLESSRGIADLTDASQQMNTDLPSDLALSAPTGPSTDQSSSQSSDIVDPFAGYRAEYQFQTGSSTAIANTFSDTQSDTSSSEFNFGTGLVNPAAPSSDSALSEALRRQRAAREQTREQTSESTDTQSITRIEDQNEAIIRRQPNSQLGPSNINVTGIRSDNATSSNQPAGLSIAPQVSPYLPTTPATSPPVGTTGYQPPAAVPLPSPILPTQSLRRLSPTSGPTSESTSVPLLPSSVPAGVLYTPPTFTQPDQGRPINPRR